MPLPAILGAVALRYWKPLAGLALAFVLIGGIYWKGRVDCARKINEATQKETVRRYENEKRTREEDNTRRHRVDQDRAANPANDLRDSCLLSNNPFEVDCLARGR